MYHVPDASIYRAGDVLTVEDILATDVTLDGAYAQLPADMHCPCDAELDALLPWRRPAGVLRELHRRRAGEVVSSRACSNCAPSLVPELLTPVQHPSDPDRTVMLLDAVLDLAGGMFELVAGSRPLAKVVDEFLDSTRGSTCGMPDCAEPARRRHDGIPAFAVSVLGVLGSWAYDAGVTRDTEVMVNEAWATAVEELRESAEGMQLTTAELFERASTDPRIVAAESHVPSRWADSDWGSMVRIQGESPTLVEVASELGVDAEAMVLSVIAVAAWLGAKVDGILAD